MCRRVTCPSCGKPDWAGCGAHIEAVLGDVPKDARCRCRELPPSERPKPEPKASWLGRLFGS
ncbi:MAG: hypothetical protein RLZZ383_65 [Pseudomonadota bacterium]|jgi:hypothetical protein